MRHVTPSHHPGGPRRGGFSLIELLVVVAIISTLIAILMPSLSKARATSKMVVCGTQVKQITTASIAYSTEYRGWAPFRGKDVGGGLPHLMINTGAGAYDLNTGFFDDYLGISISNVGGRHRENDKILFCPGSLIDVRYPGLASPDYRYAHITYQYFVMPDRKWKWLHTKDGVAYQPDLTRLDQVPAGQWPLWSDLTMTYTPSGTTWLGHDAPSTATAPSGMNAAYVDGSVAWVAFDECEPFFQESLTTQQWYWPRPYD